MHARKLLAGLATTAVAMSTIALSAGSASAAYTADPDDTVYTASGDLIGVGSDTTQHALKLAADAWNAQTPAPAFKVATYAATGGGDITLPGTDGTIPRPNGSGAGIGRLYGDNNKAEIDFARSSSAISTTEANAGLRAFAFALDSLQMAVSSTTPSNAPASITPKQIVGIYDGTIKNWSAIDSSKSGVIEAMIPQGGSGTRKFFEAELKAINNNVAVSLRTDLVEVQEHSDVPIKGNANAIAPFSVGRAGLTGGTVRLLSGWNADRAVYNVVRSTSLANATEGPKLRALFAEDGYLCSPAAKSSIVAAGFKQLATPVNGGACGSLLSGSTTNFLTSDPVATTVDLVISSTTARTATLTASVKGATAPRGTVSFFDGTTALASNVALVSGQAKTTVSNLTPGARSYKAVYTPAAGSYFVASEKTASGTVKTSSSLTAKFPKKAKAGQKVKGKVTVELADVTTAATGKIVVKAGSKTVGTGTLKAGKATVTLKKLKSGVNKLKVVWDGDASATGSTSKTIKVKVAKAKK